MNYDRTMQPYTLISIAAVAACWLLQWLLVFRIDAALKDRHPETHQAVSGNHLAPGWGVNMFIWSNGEKWLDDPAISRDVLRIKLLAFVALVAAISAAFTLEAPNS